MKGKKQNRNKSNRGNKRITVEKISETLELSNIKSAKEKSEEVIDKSDSYIIAFTIESDFRNTLKSLHFDYMKCSGDYRKAEYAFFRIILLFLIEKENIPDSIIDDGILNLVRKRGRRKSKNPKAKREIVRYGAYRDNTKFLLDKVICWFASQIDDLSKEMHFFSIVYFVKKTITYVENNSKELNSFKQKNS